MKLESFSPFKPAAKVQPNQGETAWMRFQAQLRWTRVCADLDLAVLKTEQGLVGGGAFAYFSRCSEK